MQQDQSETNFSIALKLHFARHISTTLLSLSPDYQPLTKMGYYFWAVLGKPWKGWNFIMIGTRKIPWNYHNVFGFFVKESSFSKMKVLKILVLVVFNIQSLKGHSYQYFSEAMETALRSQSDAFLKFCKIFWCHLMSLEWNEVLKSF